MQKIPNEARKIRRSSGEGLRGKRELKVTSLPSAEAADPRFSGSTEKSLSTRAKAEAGKSLNVSATQRLYRR